MSTTRRVTPLFAYLRVTLTYGFASLSMIDHTVSMLARPPSRALFLRAEDRNAGIHVMTNTNEHATTQVLNTSEHGTAQVFGLSLMAIFVGLLILNGISF